jgi:hypothetical protein
MVRLVFVAVYPQFPGVRPAIKAATIYEHAGGETCSGNLAEFRGRPENWAEIDQRWAKFTQTNKPYSSSLVFVVIAGPSYSTG